MKDKISFSDLTVKYAKNAAELKEIDKLNIDYQSIVENKKKILEDYEKIISSINSDNQKDFEEQSKIYMEKITELEEEIRKDEEKKGRKEKLIGENKKIVEDAKARKNSLEKQVLEDYEKNLKDDEKNIAPDVKKAREELKNYKEQLAKMKEDEINYPNKVKDTKYKEFLENKIEEKNKFLEANDKSSADEIKEFLLNEIKEEYLAFKKGISKEYMPEEAKNPNPVFEAAKKNREEKGVPTSENPPVGGTAKGVSGEPLKPLKRGTSVIIGRKGQIWDGISNYKISSQTIKKALNMEPDEVIGVMKDNGLNVPKELEDAIKSGIGKFVIDPIVLVGICSVKKMPDETKKLLLAHYLEDGIKAINKKGTKNSLNLSYDQKDLSKSSILKRIFKREIDAEEKFTMVKMARVGERYGVAKAKGEYKPTITSRVISFLTRNSIPKLPTMEETIEVAEKYNKARDNGFRESLKEQTKGLSKEQKREYISLQVSQEKQESSKGAER